MKSIDEIRDRISKYDFSYSGAVEYDYDRVEAYDHDERCANDYCRCTTLEDFVITKINVDLFVNVLQTNLGIEHVVFKNDIVKICENLNTDDFEFNVSGGYYGEELDSISLSNYEVIEKLTNIFSIKGYRKAKLEQIMTNSENDNYVFDEYVKTILTKEYGYILSSLEKSKFKIVEINTSDIVFPQNEYNGFVKTQNLSGYKNRKDICGLVKLVGDKYHVIDGYHRINANINKSTIKVILAY